jgi:pyridoxine/pyridoxamine 5'-phosphate oxidase
MQANKEQEMEEQNLDIYGHDPIPWSRAANQLAAQAREEGKGRTCWLATTDPDGKPHLAAVGALWVDDKFYFTSGPRLRKSRNLAANPRCAISVSLNDIDVVVEGTARKVTDPLALERVANLYASLGWPARASSGAITAEFSAPSAGRGPWDLYAVTPTTAVGVATKEPFGATRWRFTGDAEGRSEPSKSASIQPAR